MESSLINIYLKINMKNYLYLIVIVFLFHSCTKVNTLDDIPARAVVEGYLSDGQPISIKISKEIKFESNDTIAAPINGLNLTIFDNTASNKIFLAGSDSGIYYSPEKIISGHSYTLSFDYQSQKITATTSIPSKPTGFAISTSQVTVTQINIGGGFPGGGGARPNFGDAIALSWTNDDQSFYLTAYKNLETNPESIITGAINFGFARRPTFNQPTQGSTAQINPIQLEYFGSFDVYCMHVQPEYAALYQQTNNTSINLAPPPTNIENGLGIFTGYSVDTLRLVVKKG